MRIRIYLAVVASMLSACSAPPQDRPEGNAAAQPDALTAADLDVGPILTAAEYAADPQFAAADLDRGATLSLACIACHTLKPGEDHMLGPNLGHIFGAPAASKSGFMYSAALAESGLVWTPRALDAWLAAPSSFVPGTSMVFAGYGSPDERRDLIAYLLRATEASGQ